MNRTKKVLVALLFFGTYLSGCSPDPMQQDVRQLGDVWCRYLEIMNKRQYVDPEDTLADSKIESEVEKILSELDSLNSTIQEKYGKKSGDSVFTKKFNTELQKVMLNCPHLSKTDREKIEKELKKN